MKSILIFSVTLLFAFQGAFAMETTLLTLKERAIIDLSAATARGDQSALASALNAGFDAGLTLSEAKELVGQLYAYCGFPCALNAASTLMRSPASGVPPRGARPARRRRARPSSSAPPTRRSSAGVPSVGRSMTSIRSWTSISRPTSSETSSPETTWIGAHARLPPSPRWRPVPRRHRR